MLPSSTANCKRILYKFSCIVKSAVKSFATGQYLVIPSLRPCRVQRNNVERRWIYSNSKAMSEFIYTNNTPVVLLQCEDAFNELTDKEKLYAHHLSRSGWYGGLICLFQTSIESPLIFTLLTKLFRFQTVAELKEVALKQCNFTEDDYQAFLIYACGMLYNMGNYKSFGDSKFIPNLDKEKFRKLILSSKFAASCSQEVNSLLSRCLEKIYSLSDKEQRLGFPEQGSTGYLSKNITKEDSELVNEFLKKNNIEAFNTRLFKTVDGSGKVCYEIRLASIIENASDIESELLKEDTINGRKFIVTRGDYSKLLSLVNDHLVHAQKYAANENEIKMIEKYIHSFKTGSLDAHKDGSRYWVKDKGPIIETYIGFIETYQDPAGIRGEFECFVAMVNKKLSAKFADLVNSAESFISLLPWPSSFEKDSFLQPDFTSLDILTYAGSTPPSGICIPNYDEIRQSEGFKNVYLGNVTQSTTMEPPNYLSKEDQELYFKYRVSSFAINVGLHELLGHGSGKLFMQEKNGTLNFDPKTVKNFKTNQDVTWYKEGENYGNIFGDISSSYEECRAECVALHLCDVPEVLKIFSEGVDPETMIYSVWLLMAHSGLESLQMYEPKTKSWLQAHCQARYVILQVLLEAGQDFVKVEKIEGADGNPDLLFSMDRTKIATVGKPAISEFLAKLQLHKSMADVASGKEMYNRYSAVTADGKYPFLTYRDIVMARKKPRKMFVQANTFLEDGNVKLKNYEASPAGMIESWMERFQLNEVENILEEVWAKNKDHF